MLGKKKLTAFTAARLLLRDRLLRGTSTYTDAVKSFPAFLQDIAIQRVKNPIPLPFVLNQAHRFKDAQMLRDRGLGNLQGLSYGIDTLWLHLQELNDLDPLVDRKYFEKFRRFLHDSL